jgi:membrane protease YdiL (CAAX protease family)
MKLGMAVDVAMLVAALGFGIYAILQWRRTGQDVIAQLGLRWDRSAPFDLLAGVAITTLAMLGIFIAELGLGAIRTEPAAGVSLPSLALLALGKMALTFKEELLMRGMLLSGLMLALRGRAALAVGASALAFGLIHFSNPGSTALSILGNALGGVMYAIAFLAARNLWLPIGLHFAWNFVQGPLLGFPVSGMDAGGLQHVHDLGPSWLTGGGYGPEAGLVGSASRFVVIALVLLWCGWRARIGAPVKAASA